MGKFFFNIALTLFNVAENSSGAIFEMSVEGNSVLNRLDSPKLEAKGKKFLCFVNLFFLSSFDMILTLWFLQFLG